ncbi:MAG: LysM peptidoglycan-binding domain-containing protein [Deltaproteobacteria bacterium]|nr:LysM peptidoglycan-binding domain-containing protein [Deltaproteobacteria bacterium]
MRRFGLSAPSILSLVALAAIMATSCGAGGGSRNSTIGRQASQVAREGRGGGQKYYQLGPQFEQRLDQMVGQEIMALSSRKEDLPLELNQDVLVNLRYFLNDARGFMIRSLSRGQKYIPMMKAILRQKGLPEDLVYLALIESGFRTEAVSTASAVGPWQFIAGTGRRYGLVIDEWVDERMDPVKSTYAAADYLTALHEMFKSWPLAIAAYNTGEGKIQRGMRDPDTDNYWDMARRDGFLANETKRYVPSFLAVTIISKDPQAYGLEIESAPPDAWEDVVVPDPMDLSLAASLSGSTLERLKELNPHLKRMATPPNEANFVLRVPEGSRANFYRLYAQLPEARRGGGIITHTARRGETVDQVASRYQLTPAVVRQYNNLPEGARLAGGQQLVLPASMPPETTSDVVVAAAQQTASRPSSRPEVPAPSSEPWPEPATAPAPPASQPPRPAAVASSQPRRSQVINSISHRVRSGDTILGIAKLYGVKAEQIKSDNKLASNDIMEGQVLNIRSNLPLTAATSSRASRNTWVEVSEGVPVSHTVQKGETISSIAANYRVSQRQLMDLNNLSSNTIRVGQRLAIGTGPAPSRDLTGSVEYTVVSGDTVSTIAERHGLTSEELRGINNLSGNNIRAGQKLRVPASAQGAPSGGRPAEYEVQRGDTVGQIAERLGVGADDLRRLNDLSGDIIRVGQRLKIAGGGTVERTYEVVAGDTLGGIAGRHGMSSAQLRELNGLTGDNLRIGQKLKVLEGGQAAQASQAAASAQAPRTSGDFDTYVVQAGDTVSQIAERFGMGSAELREINNLRNDGLRVGQRLFVIPGQPVPAAASGEYVVQAGDTLSQIAERHGLRSAELRELNGLSGDVLRPGQRLKVAIASQAAAATTAAPAQRRPESPAARATSSSTGEYVVQAGDTLSQIAERHGLRSADLRELNGLAGDVVRVGQRLRVPVAGQTAPSQRPAESQASTVAAPAGEYVVQGGDTLSQIAERHGLRSAELRELNGLSGDSIRVGQRLRVPGTGRTAPAPPSAERPAASPAGEYVVQSGDTLSQIAERHGLRSAELRELNNLQGDSIRVGQRLKVGNGGTGRGTASSAPSGGADTYKVAAGDTMYSIATRHGLTVDGLKALNGRQSDIVRPGEVLRVR